MAGLPAGTTSISNGEIPFLLESTIDIANTARFYVNVYTKKSQWEKPTSPVYPPNEDGAPSDPPPGYEPSDSAAASQAGDTKKNPFEERPPFNSAGTSSSDPDAAMAAKLQAEEEARARGGAGTPGYAGPGGPFPSGQSPYPAQQAPYGQPGSQQGQQGSFPQDLPPRDRGKSSGGGLLGKLKAKVAGASSSSHGGYPQQQYGGAPQQGGYYPPQQGYGPGPGGPGGYPGGYGGPQYNQGYGRGYGPPGGMYGGHPGMYGGGYPQQQQRRGGGGMGMAGGAAMGLGAGMLGGMMIGSAMGGGDEQEAYQDGFGE